MGAREKRNHYVDEKGGVHRRWAHEATAKCSCGGPLEIERMEQNKDDVWVIIFKPCEKCNEP